MLICPDCQHAEPEGEAFCGECGTQLFSPWFVPSHTTHFQSSRLHGLGPTIPLPPDPLGDVLQPGQIGLVIANSERPLVLHGQHEYLLGREEGKHGQPDVNLNFYGAEVQGVSRVHAALTIEQRRVLLTDLGSANGTRLNGTSLTPREPVRLESGDELRLGRLSLRIYFQL